MDDILEIYFEAVFMKLSSEFQLICKPCLPAGYTKELSNILSYFYAHTFFTITELFEFSFYLIFSN